MHYLEYNEPIVHRTGDAPLAFYPVDERHPRYRMRLHWHRETELIRVLRGRLHLYVDDETLDAEPGDLVVVGDGALHSGEPDGCQYQCIVLDLYQLTMHLAPCKRVMKDMIGHTVLIKNQSIAAEPELAAAVERLYGYGEKGIEGKEMQAVGAVIELFGHLAAYEDAHVRVCSTRSGVRAAQLKPALEYIEKNYASHISLETLARLTGLSPKYFCRCFRAIVHRSPIDYLNYYRVECAGFFLATTDMTVAEIAQQCGFSDSSFFIKQFRKYKNTTPRKYRTGVVSV